MYETTPSVKAKSGAPLGSHTRGSFLIFNKKIPGVGEVPALLTVLRIDAVSYISYYHATVLSVVVGATWAYNIMANATTTATVTVKYTNTLKLEDGTKVYFHIVEKIKDICEKDHLNVEEERNSFKMPQGRMLDQLTTVLPSLCKLQPILKNDVFLTNVLGGATMEIIRVKHLQGEVIEGETLTSDTFFTEITKVKLTKMGEEAVKVMQEDFHEAQKDMMRKMMGL